jgi:hypothetical protein
MAAKPVVAATAAMAETEGTAALADLPPVVAYQFSVARLR